MDMAIGVSGYREETYAYTCLDAHTHELKRNKDANGSQR